MGVTVKVLYHLFFRNPDTRMATTPTLPVIGIDTHPILGRSIAQSGDVRGRIYTRTVVLWAIGITIDPKVLWENVDVRCEVDNRLIREDVEIQSSSLEKNTGTSKPQPPRDQQKKQEHHQRLRPERDTYH